MLKKNIDIDYNKDFEIEVKMKIEKASSGGEAHFIWGCGSNNWNSYTYSLSTTHSPGVKINKFTGTWREFHKHGLFVDNSEIRVFYGGEYNGIYFKLTIRKIANTYYFFQNGIFIYSMPYIQVFGNYIGFMIQRNIQLYVDYIKIYYQDNSDF